MLRYTSRITATGAYLPDNVIYNNDLPKHLNTSDEWIVKRTGIKKRHFVHKNQSCADIAFEAANKALANSHIAAHDIDAIIVATTTPDNTFPATAASVHKMLNIPPCPFFDIQAVCSGFLYALNMAHNMIALDQAKHILVIGAEVYSRILDVHDRSTYVLFGDGAGAVILSQEPLIDDKAKQSGILSIRLNGNGQYNDMLYVDGGVASTQQAGFVRMNGREVFKQAVTHMSDIVRQCCIELQLTPNDINIFIPHQANQRIMDGVADQLAISKDSVISTVSNHANISAATIPVALDYALQNNKINPNDVIALSALGGGFAWGGAIMRWA